MSDPTNGQDTRSTPLSVFQSREVAYSHEQKTYNSALLNLSGASLTLFTNAVFYQFPVMPGLALAATYAQQYAAVSSREIRYNGTPEVEIRNNLASTRRMIIANSAAAAVQIGAQASVLIDTGPQTVKNYNANHKGGMVVAGAFSAVALSMTAACAYTLLRNRTHLRTVRALQQKLPAARTHN